MLRQFLVSVVVALLVGSAAAAGPFEDGLSAYNRGNYATALRAFRPLAEQADARAQYNLGLMYWYGDGVPSDNSEAIKWFRRAAEQGLPQHKTVWALCRRTPPRG